MPQKGVVPSMDYTKKPAEAPCSVDGGAIAIVATATTLKDNITFAFNSASQGGAMHFKDGAIMTLEPSTNLTLSRNYATTYGGGIYQAMQLCHEWIVLNLGTCFTEEITSEPYMLCFCENNNCTKSTSKRTFPS